MSPPIAAGLCEHVPLLAVAADLQIQPDVCELLQGLLKVCPQRCLANQPARWVTHTRLLVRGRHPALGKASVGWRRVRHIESTLRLPATSLSYRGLVNCVVRCANGARQEMGWCHSMMLVH